MKIFRLTKVILVLIGLVIFNSCVEDDDFEVPNTTITEPILNGPIVSINSAYGNYLQAVADGDDFFTYEFDSGSDYLEGFVVSTDEGGNFFEELIIQDELENPTIGIKVLIDVNPLFTKYELGRKIYIKLDGLTVGISNGVFSIGIIFHRY